MVADTVAHVHLDSYRMHSRCYVHSTTSLYGLYGLYGFMKFDYMLIYYSPYVQATYIAGSGQASSAIGGLHDVSDLSRCPTSKVTCPHGPQSGSELASKLQVGYSSNMHEVSLSHCLPLHKWVLACRPCPPSQLAVVLPRGG